MKNFPYNKKNYKNIQYVSPKFYKAYQNFLEIAEIARKEMGDGIHLNAISHFEIAKNTSLYRILYRMPKGALTHHHIPIHGLPDYIANLGIKENNIYTDMKNEKIFTSKDDDVMPKGIKKLSEYESVEEIKRLFLLDTRNLDEYQIWRTFEKKYCNVKTIISNTKYFKEYIHKLFNDCIDEGILIYQGRHIFRNIAIYDTLCSSEIKYLDPVDEIKIFLEVLEEVRKKEPLFKVNLIHAGLRTWPLDVIKNELDLCIKLKNISPEYDDIILGFDLVGDESLKESKYFSKLLHDYKEKVINENILLNSNLEFYLHSGESMSEDNLNMIDSIELKCLRIGHGINLIKHPDLLDRIKENDICLEICPLSNQILKYVSDLRIHPLKYFYERGIKMTINSDDDGIFGNESLLTYDLFVCIVCLNMDLEFLNNCLSNSLKYSGIIKDKLNIIENEWNRRWNDYITFLENM